MDENRNVIKKCYNIRKIEENVLLKYLESVSIINKMRVLNYVEIMDINIIPHEIQIKRYTYDFSLEVLLTTKELDISFIDDMILKMCRSELILNDLCVYNGNLNMNNILFDEKNEMYISEYCLNTIRDIENIINENYKYISPEMMLYNESDMSSDIWSIGLIIYKILKKMDLIDGNNKNEIEKSIFAIESKEIIMNENEDIDIKTDENKNRNENYEYIIRNCLRVYNKDRITIDEIIIILKKNKIHIEEKRQFDMLYNNISFYISDDIFKKIKHQEIINHEEIKYICNNEDIIYKLVNHFNRHNLIYDYCILQSMRWETEHGQLYYTRWPYNRNNRRILETLNSASSEKHELRLKETYFCMLSLSYFQELCVYFKYFSNVQCINLNSQKLGDEGVILLINDLKYLKCLRDLDISETEISNDSIICFYENQVIMPDLITLRLQNNNFNKMIVKYIRLSINLLPKCENIYIDGFKESTSSIVSLQRMYPKMTFKYPRIN